MGEPVNATLVANATRPLVLNDDNQSDNTLTFVIGFGILILFVLMGILASAFLCVTLKKDPYLWEVERERQMMQDKCFANDAGERKNNDRDEMLNQESTQI